MRQSHSRKSLTVLLLVERSVTASSTKGVGFGVTFTAGWVSIYSRPDDIG